MNSPNDFKWICAKAHFNWIPRPKYVLFIATIWIVSYLKKWAPKFTKQKLNIWILDAKTPANFETIQKPDFWTFKMPLWGFHFLYFCHVTKMIIRTMDQTMSQISNGIWKFDHLETRWFCPIQTPISLVFKSLLYSNGQFFSIHVHIRQNKIASSFQMVTVNLFFKFADLSTFFKWWKNKYDVKMLILFLRLVTKFLLPCLRGWII